MINPKGYKIIFSTELSDDEIEDKIDDFLREVDEKEIMAHAQEMTQEEIAELFKI